MLQVSRPPPPHYYADKLCSVFETVERQYSDILTPDERRYLGRVLNLSAEAKRLYARLVTRKGPLFRVDSLNYRELRQPQAAIDALAANRLIDHCGCVPADRLLKLLTLTELGQLFPREKRTRKYARKAMLVDRLAGRYPERLIRDRVLAAQPCVSLRTPELIDLVRLLFFGDTRQDLSTFVLEDLGVVRYEPYLLARSARNFRSREDLDTFVSLLNRRAELHEVLQTYTSDRAAVLLETLWETLDNRALERTRSRLLNALARQAERTRDFELAIAAYRRSSREPARERRARVLARLGDPDGARRVVADMAGANGRERAFAASFDPAIGTATRRRRRYAERHLRLPQAPSISVERAALSAITANVGWGAHAENLLPRTILGLAFWDIIFAPISGAFSNPYQAGPRDLYWADFRAVRSAAIEARLEELGHTNALRRRVLDTWRSKHGTNNALVSWRLSPQFIDAAVSIIGSKGWVPILDHMLNDLEVTRTGFPDLTIILGCGHYQFVEVKGPGDQMRPEQRLWFEFFNQHDIPSFVLRVSW